MKGLVMKKIAVLIAAMLLGSDVALHAMDEKTTDNNAQEEIGQMELEEEFGFAMFFDLLSDKTSEKLNKLSCPNIKKKYREFEKFASKVADHSTEMLTKFLEENFNEKESSDETSDPEALVDHQDMLTTMLAGIEVRDEHIKEQDGQIEKLELELLDFRAILQAMQE